MDGAAGGGAAGAEGAVTGLDAWPIGARVRCVQYIPGRGDWTLGYGTIASTSRGRVTLADGSTWRARSGVAWGAVRERGIGTSMAPRIELAPL